MKNEIMEEIITIKISDYISINAVAGYSDFCESKEIMFIFAPHPLLGGDLNNNVVDALFKGFASDGKIAVKLSYRGVDSGYVNGEPFLKYWDNLEQSKNFTEIVCDSNKIVSEIIDKFNMRLPKIGFIAYSFGNIIALELKEKYNPEWFLGIAPPINDYNFENLFNQNKDTHFIISNNDVFCDTDKMNGYCSLYNLKTTICGDDHFFRGFETELYQKAFSLITGENI